MSTFDPAAIIATAEAAGATMHLMIHSDGSRALSTWTVGVDWDRMPSLGLLTDEQVGAVLDEIWRQGRSDRIHYAGPPPRRRAAS